METITEKDVKRVWLEKDAVCVELNDGRIGKEFFKDYAPLRNASDEDRTDFRLDLDGVWFDRIGDGLELSGFFAPKKNNPIGRVFCEFPMLNASAVARRFSIPQPLFAAYVSGAKKPSAARQRKILDEIAKIGREIAAVAG